MTPLRHYEGPLLPGAGGDALGRYTELAQEGLPAPGDTGGEAFRLAALTDEQVQAARKAFHVEDDPPAAAAPDPDVIGQQAQQEVPILYPLSGQVIAYPNSTYGVHLDWGGLTAEGNGEHPELAMMLAFTKLWSQIDRPRCVTCGQLLPEEGQTL